MTDKENREDSNTLFSRWDHTSALANMISSYESMKRSKLKDVTVQLQEKIQNAKATREGIRELLGHLAPCVLEICVPEDQIPEDQLAEPFVYLNSPSSGCYFRVSTRYKEALSLVQKSSQLYYVCQNFEDVVESMAAFKLLKVPE